MNSFTDRFRLLLFIIILSCFPAIIQAEDSTNITYLRPIITTNITSQYVRDQLIAALDSTRDEYGEYTLTPSTFKTNQKRGLRHLEKNNEIDLMWTMTSRNREDKLLPVRIPLYKGLFGLRVCIVKLGDADRFHNIRSLTQWKKSGYVIGQGSDWPDTRVLEANDLTLFTTPNYDSLFKLVARGRFDCFARSILEPANELTKHEVGQLEVDNHLLFQYSSPIYFFVNKSNTKLARRLELGLNRTIENGAFSEIFNRYYQDILNNMEIDSRQVLRLDNPDMSALTPIDDKKYWLDIFYKTKSED